MLSTFEAKLLERHLRRCGSCRAFAAGAAAQTRLLRTAELEQPLGRVTLPARPARRIARRGLAATLATGLAAAAALVAVSSSSDVTTSVARASAAPQLFVYAARLDPNAPVDVPRLRVEPASAADGPVHGPYSVPA